MPLPTSQTHLVPLLDRQAAQPPHPEVQGHMAHVSQVGRLHPLPHAVTQQGALPQLCAGRGQLALAAARGHAHPPGPQHLPPFEVHLGSGAAL